MRVSQLLRNKCCFDLHFDFRLINALWTDKANKIGQLEMVTQILVARHDRLLWYLITGFVGTTFLQHTWNNKRLATVHNEFGSLFTQVNSRRTLNVASSILFFSISTPPPSRTSSCQLSFLLSLFGFLPIMKFFFCFLPLLFHLFC